jgi:drug/metabolite transporter (DMT)-like permease
LRTVIFTTTFLAILACLLWSTAFVGIKIGLEYTTPLRFAGIRFFLSGLYILPFAGKIRESFRLLYLERKQVIRVGFFQTLLLYSLFYTGISMVPAATTAIIIGAGPLFASIMAHLMLHDDKFTLKNMGSILLGMTGVVIIAFTREKFSWSEGREFWGILILITANLSGSIGNVTVVKYRSSLSPLLLSSGQLMVGGLGIFLLSLPFEGIHFTINEPAYYASLGWLSFMSAAAFSIWFTLLKRPGVKVSALNIWKFLIPVFGALLSWLILPEEQPVVVQVAGMVFIVLSLVVLNLKFPWEKKKNSSGAKSTDRSSYTIHPT